MDSGFKTLLYECPDQQARGRMSPHTHSVIVLHDLNTNSRDFGRDLLKDMGKGLNNRILFRYMSTTHWCFPTINYPKEQGGGQVDLYRVFETSGPQNRREILGYLRQILKPVLEIIDRERTEILSQNVFICGSGTGSTAAPHILLCFQTSQGSQSLGGSLD